MLLLVWGRLGHGIIRIPVPLPQAGKPDEGLWIHCAAGRRQRCIRPPKTKPELEALVLAELRAVSQCGGVVHVTVVPFDDYRAGASPSPIRLG
jgi:hypothetical protein